jgi:hypothetical protein
MRHSTALSLRAGSSRPQSPAARGVSTNPRRRPAPPPVWGPGGAPSAASPAAPPPANGTWNSSLHRPAPAAPIPKQSASSGRPQLSTAQRSAVSGVSRGKLDERRQDSPRQDDWNGITQPCPYCGIITTRAHQSRCPRRVVRCEGCEEPVSAAALAVHREACGGVTIQCPGCHVRITRRLLQSHVTLNCPATAWPCGECGEAFTDSLAFVRHALPGCIRRIVPCQLCHVSVPYATLASHLVSCAEEQLNRDAIARRRQQRSSPSPQRRLPQAGARQDSAQRQRSRSHSEGTADGKQPDNNAIAPWDGSPDKARDETRPASNGHVSSSTDRTKICGAPQRSATGTLLATSPVRLRRSGSASPTRPPGVSSIVHESKQRLQRSLTDAAKHQRDAQAERQRTAVSPAPSPQPAASTPTAARRVNSMTLPEISILAATLKDTLRSASPSPVVVEPTPAASAASRTQTAARSSAISPRARSPIATRTSSAVTRTHSNATTARSAATTHSHSLGPASRWTALVNRSDPPAGDDVFEPLSGRCVRDLPAAEQLQLRADWRRAHLSAGLRVKQHLDRVAAAEARRGDIRAAAAAPGFWQATHNIASASSSFRN